VAGQAALSVVLVVGAGLFVQSLRRVHAVSLGVEVKPLTFASVVYSDFDSTGTRLDVLKREAARAASLPGVEGASISVVSPLHGELGWPIRLASGDTVAIDGYSSVSGNAVGPGYFAVVGMRLLDGRDFAASDGPGAPKVLVVNQSLAKRLWPGERAIGKCLVVGDKSAPCREVIGVVSDANLWSIKPEAESEHAYVDIDQEPRVQWLALTVRSSPTARSSMVNTLRADLLSELPASAQLTVSQLDESLARDYRPWTLGATVFSAMGLLALLVAGVGIYSTVGYSVAQRIPEIGVRMALGAGQREVMRSVLVDGMRLAAVGVIAGCAWALLAGKLIASLLYDTSPRDVAPMIVAALVLFTAAALAALIPARRAARVDPVIALRAE
jgi:predicted permease